jgi:hypothetical protein
MDKLIKSRKFVYGVLSLVAFILIPLFPQTEKWINVLIPGIAVIYGCLAFGTTFEDSFKAWASGKAQSLGQAAEDVALEVAKSRTTEVQMPPVAFTKTAEPLDPTAQG